MDLVQSLDCVSRGQSVPAATLAELLRKGQVTYQRGRLVLTPYGHSILDMLRKAA